jgi:hypothetical protein
MHNSDNPLIVFVDESGDRMDEIEEGSPIPDRLTLTEAGRKAGYSLGAGRLHADK